MSLMNAKEETMEETALSRCAARLSPAASAEEGEIVFASGEGFPGLFPDLTAAAHVALTTYRAETLQYGMRPGIPELREWIAEYMVQDGAKITPEEILIVNGAKHGLELACRLLLDEGDSIVVTAPTYFTAIPIFRSFGVEFIEAPQDDEGLHVGELERLLDRHAREERRTPKFIYNVPDYHNPTGVTMSRPRRDALLALARSRGIRVIEDSPYRKVRFEGEALPGLKALDRANTVITLGTFSKLIAPGLRIGWVAASPDILGRMMALKADGGTCPLTQRIILEFARGGGISDHIPRVQATYRAHRDRMVAALQRSLPEASCQVPRGGYYLWLKFPASVDTEELASRAAHAGVAVIPGSRFFAGKVPPKNFMRLAYSFESEERIDEGIRRLARAYRSMGMMVEASAASGAQDRERKLS